MRIRLPIARDSTVAHGGHTSIRFHADDEPSGFATIATSLPASPYLGRRVRFSVYVRGASLGGGGAQLWARADGANQPSLAFGQASAVIFDMRGYPRASTLRIFTHLTDTVIHSAHFMIPVITMPNCKNVGFVDGAWTIEPQAPRLKARIVFLSGGGAISYAESTLGVVEACRLGDIVGETSAGTNGSAESLC